MQQVNPNENVHLTYLIPDTTDVATYYVQAVVRNSATGAVLNTINLTRDSGNHRRFTGSFKAPGHNQADALFIDITTTVYTDAGYTTTSPNYLEQLENYLVAYRWSQYLGGGGGTMNFDWSKLSKVLSGHMGAVRKQIDGMEAPEAVDQGVLVSAMLNAMSPMVEAAVKRAVKEAKKGRASERRQLLGIIDSSTNLKKAVAEPATPVESPQEFMPPTEVLGGTRFSGPRRPSDGVVPVHIIARNRGKFPPKKKTQ